MEMNKNILKLLYRSFDSKLNKKEQNQLNIALKKSPHLRREKGLITTQRKALSDTGGQSFKPFFAERVIKQITSQKEKETGLEAFYEAIKHVFRRFAVVGAIVMLILVTYNLGIGDNFSQEEAFYALDLTYEELQQLPLF